MPAQLLWYDGTLMTMSGRVLANAITLGESCDFFPEITILACYRQTVESTRAAVLDESLDFPDYAHGGRWGWEDATA